MLTCDCSIIAYWIVRNCTYEVPRCSFVRENLLANFELRKWLPLLITQNQTSGPSTKYISTERWKRSGAVRELAAERISHNDIFL